MRLSSTYKISFISVTLLVALSLGGCAATSSYAKRESYVSSQTGQVTPINSDRESCIDHCNDDFDRCTEQSSAQRGSNYDLQDRYYGLRNIVGAQADCRNSLNDCLPRCKGR